MWHSWDLSSFDIFRFFIVQVHVKRSVMGREDSLSGENGESSHLTKPFKPLLRKSKLVVVDLAGSERIQKSGIYAQSCVHFFLHEIFTQMYTCFIYFRITFAYSL